MSSFQTKVIAELKTKPTIDPKEEIRISVNMMKDYLKKYPFLESMVLGISGGQDSTLTGKLAQIAVNELNGELGTEKYKFIAVRLPYGIQGDEDDCQDAIRFISPDEVVVVNIKDSVDASVAAVEKGMGKKLTDFLKGNVKARHRMETQYSIAGAYKGIVLGTDHAAEAITGFYTKFGDGAADMVPIFRLNKRQGKQLLKELGCPEHLYLKVPTADLEDDRPQLPDEVALGVTYDEIDDYLEGKEVNENSKTKIETWFKKSEHKRQAPISVFDNWWK
ncbi:ammonia-dependent NAD(+) synthetase [Bacillus sp. CGMCC 1.16607]|uniref:ammonia-dependent NAD(+) synthetase n=1 Tax=Bacillus sp. CGMCC 1.16607 TaxID=3351842 RepID=UPI0036434703